MIPIALLAALGAMGGAGIGAAKGGGRGALLGGLLGGGAGYGIPALAGMGAAGASATPALGPGLMEMSGALTPAGVGTAAAPAAGGMSKMWPLLAMAAAPGVGSALAGGGGGRSAPPAGRGGMGRVGPLPSIYQNNPMQFKAMLAEFLRGR